VLRPWVAAVSRIADALLAKTGLSRGPLGMGVTRQDLQLVLDESDELARLGAGAGAHPAPRLRFAEDPVAAVMAPRTPDGGGALGTTLGRRPGE